VIRRFMKRYPQIRLSLHQGNPTQIAELTIGGQADLAIATEAIALYDELVMLPCYQWNRCVVCPPRHPLMRVKPLALEAVAEHPLITYDFAFTGRSTMQKAFEARGLTPNVVLTAIDADVIKTYVELGLGVGILAMMAFEPSVRAERHPHRHPAPHLPARLCLRVHRDVRPAPDARSGRGRDGVPRVVRGPARQRAASSSSSRRAQSHSRNSVTPVATAASNAARARSRSPAIR
jgi:DNA-binding transcriptional LysR family regulator